MSDFYNKIREYYDYIFPLNNKLVLFIRNFFEKKSKILEVGCANGKLVNALTMFEMTGIDLEEEFIAIARARYPESKFLALNMLDIQTLNEEYDGVICFGNTLVHIDNEQINDFLAQVYSILKPGGRLLVQIVNYDRIFNEKLDRLPVIDNKIITFERRYEQGKHFIFKAKLIIKNEGVAVESEVELYPLKKDELLNKLECLGFRNIEIFGGYDFEEFDISSMALILKAEKP